jgi:alkylation response protein AidB-like acyl-CoA dehydrogenase
MQQRVFGMNFTPSASLEGTRTEFRAWLARHLPSAEEWERLRSSNDTDARIAFLKSWQRALYDARWVAVHFPAEYGGRDASILDHLVVTEELLRVEAPPLINGHSISISGPTLLAFGTAAQKARFLPKLLSAEEVWCLGFSEPNAGSDLASLRTRAVRDGDDWVLNGQKVWTTYANQSRFGLFLVRTDPQAANHKGISCVIVPIPSDGLTVRPLREITGDNDFNEVFLDNVHVPATNLVGEVNRGWQVILNTLGHERSSLVVVDRVRMVQHLERLVRLARRAGAENPQVRQQVAQFRIDVEIMKLHSYKILSELEQQRPPTDASVLKLFGSELTQRLHDYGLALQGPYAQLSDGGPRVLDDGVWQYQWLLARSSTIASGTSEVQRNIIAQRLLGLPR